MAEAEGALDLVVGSWVGGSERKRKSQPGVAWHGLSAKLCRLSCVLLLLLLLLAAGPVLLVAWRRHRPLHPLPCPAAVVDVCCATVFSSVCIRCFGGPRLHRDARMLRVG